MRGTRVRDDDEGTLILIFESWLSAHLRYNSVFRAGA